MTSCRPARRTSFPSLGGATPALVFRSHAAERCRGRVSRSWSPGISGRAFVSGDDRISYVPGEPPCALALLFDPGRTDASGLLRCTGAAPAMSTAKAPAKQLSRLNHTASALAVYASQAGSPRHHARLASGCWPDSSGRAWLPAGFHRKVSRCILHPSSFPKFNVAQGHSTFSTAPRLLHYPPCQKSRMSPFVLQTPS
jgi:hypothetical protein